ncbi:exodeoxyribonuclease V subunit gamma [Tessaracoccus oleiagri]|uniref:DNA helicase/exodeoxyribonuclease V, gamma subunit n=1 Tax=Tessaracoccus oleiagri TaxID=686624 RepID=A0A1G9L8W4_9ACTN|nr:exodeoxyribonuclease V subunit gamma [Tessaracoccus oleiagri]SDL58410.1 DNA helicase/exodeoxyribonuclease V, gamma subunit [Tessaracoccus oleiagri]
MLQVRVGQSWRAMVGELVESFSEALASPFAAGRVVVDSPGSARLLSQEVAALQGISAGVEYVTVPQLARGLARQAGLADELEAWRSPRLVTAVWEELDGVAADHPLLARFLERPGRKLSAAARFARLFRSYLDHAPHLLRRWLEGDDGELAAHLTWQPELFRRVCDALQSDPVELLDAVGEASAADSTPTWLFAIDEVPAAWAPAVAAASLRGAWFVGRAPDWLGAIEHQVQRTGKPLKANPIVEVHGSHSRLRQVEVLRDQLTRCFEEDPALEPRDVRIVCPSPDEWGPVINSVFRGDGAHPGHRLRVAEVAPAVGGNLALDALVAAFELLEGRATATQVVEFLLMPAISRRWGFGQSRDDLLILVSEAEIRWGLDAAQRSRFGLPNTEYNTWFRGLDALLTGVALGSEIGPPGVAGVDATNSGDLALIGALSEVVSRLRALAHQTRGSLPVPEWCRIATQALEGLVGLGYEDAWMQRQAVAALDRLARAHEGSRAGFTRREFRRLLLADLPSRWHRPALGNGGLHVVAPDEVRHVDAKVVAFIGLGDAPQRPQPDGVPGTLPDLRHRRLQSLLAHARAARRVLVVTGTRSERTGAELEMPVTIAWLARELGVTPTVVHHAPQPFNAGAFTGPGSFDPTAYRGARRSGERAESPLVLRRRAAMTLPPQQAPSRVSLEELKRFLQDPLKEFLRARVGIRAFDDPSIEDAVPLTLDGLREWQVTDALIDGLLRHEDPAELIRRQAARQIFPPGNLGRGRSAVVEQRACEVARATEPLLADTPVTVPVALDVDGTTLSGQIAMHGGTVVRPSASTSTTPLLLAWLETLALAASGVAAKTIVIRPDRRGGPARRTTFGQPSPERATELLSLYLGAWRTGLSRLLPVAYTPAYKMALEVASERFSADQWTVPGQRAKWYPDDLWKLFYDNPACDIFDDPACEDDPPGSQSTVFERWALALYAPMIEAGGTW